MSITQQETVGECKKRIVFSFDAEKVNGVVDEIVTDIGKNYSIKGFRKGKAPAQAIKAAARKAILEEAKRRLINDAFKDILFETKMKPFGQPVLSKVDVTFSEFQMDAEVSHLPEFVLKKYQGFEFKEPTLPAKEELLERTLQDLKKQNPVIRPFGEEDFVMDGDMIIVDYHALLDGKTFTNSDAAGVVIELGSGNFIREFETNVIGMKIGEAREFEIKFPEEAPDKEIAGKTISFKVTLGNAVKKDPPEIDEAFVKRVGFETMEEFNAKISGHVDMTMMKMSRSALKNDITAALVAENPVDVPEWMQLEAAKNLCENNKTNWDTTSEQVKNHFIAEGSKLLKLAMIFEAIRETEVETVLSHEEVERLVQINASQLPPDVRAQMFDRNNTQMLMRLYAEIQDDQVFEWILKHSTLIVDETQNASKEAIAKAQEILSKPTTENENA